MPNTKSAKKALRVSERKRVFNLRKKNNLKKSLKDFRVALTKTQKEAEEKLSEVFSALDKAVKRNLLHKNKASRKKASSYSSLLKTFNIEKPADSEEKKKAKIEAKKEANKTPKIAKAKTEKKPAKKAEAKNSTKKTEAKAESKTTEKTAKKPTTKKTAKKAE